MQDGGPCAVGTWRVAGTIALQQVPSFQAQQASASSQRAWSAPICSSQYSSPFWPVDSALALSDGASKSSAVGHCCLDVSESGEMVASETPSVKVSRATSFQ